LTWPEETVKEFGCIYQCVEQETSAHFDTQQVNFDGYFSGGELNVSKQWIIDPFIINVD